MIDISDDDFEDDFEDLDHDIISIREWKNLINKWIEMVENEKDDEILNEENIENLDQLINNTMDLDHILNKEHPLINKKAKWKLIDIFDFEKLQPPTYMKLLNGNFIFIFIFYFLF